MTAVVTKRFLLMITSVIGSGTNHQSKWGGVAGQRCWIYGSATVRNQRSAAHTRSQRRRMGSMAYLAFWLILVGGKAALMYGVWRLAKAQARSPWPPLIASIFCASIVFLALFLTEHEEQLASPQNSNW